MLFKLLRAQYGRAILAASIASLATFAGCAEEETIPQGGGGNGGNTTDGGGGQSTTTTTTTTSSSSSSSTGSSMDGGGGMGGMGGMGGSGGSEPNPNYPLETEPNGTLATADALEDGTKGFTAEIEDSNDFDVFSVDVPIGSSMRVAITDGNGGCPPDAEVTVQIFDPDNLQMATATGLCPELSGQNNVDLATVDPGGVHFIRVTAAAPVPFYVIEIEVNPPVCGDNIVNLGEACDDGNLVDGDGCDSNCELTPVCGNNLVNYTEECDDGNLVNGDGCDSSCLLEGNWCFEVEPNDTSAAATPVVLCDGAAGTINPATDADWFAVDVTVPGSSIRAEVVNITGTGCPTNFDSLIRLYNGSLIELANDNDDGNNFCSLISPLSDVGATNLVPGTYFIRVEESGNNAISPAYAVLIDVLPPGCGDGVLQVGEACDDANLLPNDGCDPTCQLEGACSEAEPNNNQATANPLGVCSAIVGQVNPVGDLDYVAVSVTVPGSSIRAEITDIPGGASCPTGFDSLLRLYDSSAVQLGSDDDDGFNACSIIDPQVDLFARNLPVGTYYLAAEEFGNNATSPQYKLNVEVNPPSCGDSLVQAGEECDDGNTTPGDGCDATCQLEGNFCTESEPNDSFAFATPLTSCTGGNGSINFIGDPDYYSFTVTNPGSSVRIEVVDTTGTGCPTGFSSFIRLYNSSMTQLGTDSTDGNVNCSLIQPSTDAFATNLMPGTYFVRVEENGNDATSPPYLLLVDVNAPGCGDGIVQVGEQCDDGNSVSGDGCDPACVFEAGFCAETEPNDSQAAANVLGTCTDLYAQVNPTGDVDYFQIDIPTAGTDLRVEVMGPNGPTCPGGDSHIYLLNSMGTELGNDDDDGDGLCSLINPTVDAFAQNLAAGTYFLRFQHHTSGTVPLAKIKFTFLP